MMLFATFFQIHGHMIESTSTIADEVTITFKPEVTRPATLKFMADLLTHCQPSVASIDLRDRTAVVNIRVYE